MLIMMPDILEYEKYPYFSRTKEQVP